MLTRLVKQAGGVGPFVPVFSVTTYTLSTFISTTYDFQAAAGDVFGFQWTSTCALSALAPLPFDLRFLGRSVPPYGANVSAYATLNN